MSQGRRPVTVALAAAVVAGVALRVWLLVLPTGAFDSDEAVVGLVARHALYDGELSTFFWGQSYGGTLEPLLSAPLFAVFGAAVWTVKAVPIALLAGSAVLVWRLGRATIGEPAAAIGAAVYFVWPANLVWISTKGRGFYGVTMVVGLGLLVCAARLARRPERVADWALFGFLGGLGLWTSPLVLYFAVPAVVWVTAHAP
ncbi:MAG TPA: glycosyltransferase family 39 protein, partial [Acidimicrobiia bacterium]|nr:glycosyltransferase family 39 protein [Acidimicrobiia bacterium]